VNHLDLEERARAALEAGAYDYFAGGADDELTLADNVAAWSRLRLRPHVMRDVTVVSPATTVLGTDVSMPLLIAPTAFQRLAHDAGECATARAATRAGTVMVVSTFATRSLEDIAAAAPDHPLWFQLYVHTNRGWTENLVKRAADAGYRAIVLTVDVPVLGFRQRSESRSFTLPEGIAAANLTAAALPSVQKEGTRADGGEDAAGQFDPGLIPTDVEWLRAVADLPVVVKGILRGDDARLAVEAGADAVVVSNHGGRQLDTAITGVDALPEVVAAVGTDAEVYVDGGVRRGTDVVKALALGARAVLVGRPIVWGLACDGEQGVVDVLEALRAETARAMALCGAPTVAEITRDLVVA
jgi:4-hydroxymandelate oxidase